MTTTIPSPPTGLAPWQQRLHTVIFEADTPGGKRFDLWLLVAIVISVIAVCLESVQSINAKYESVFKVIEWTLTILFTIEYVLRLACVRRPIRYAVSFYGIVDLVSILPTYLSILLPRAQSLAVVRALRLLRIFRILKLGHFVVEAAQLQAALRASSRKIIVFMGAVLTLVLIIGSLMYLIEGREDGTGFTSIPQSIYWAIVTLTTVGYGDIAPVTTLGKFLASSVMILGYCIIAVPTGIVAAEMTRKRDPTRPISTQVCPTCTAEGHDRDAKFCRHCGARL